MASERRLRRSLARWPADSHGTGREMVVRNTTASVGDLAGLIPDFERSLRAANKSPTTLKVYGDAARSLLEFLVAHGLPTNAAKVRREHIETFIEDQLAKWRPATANQRYRSLVQFWKYLEEEGEIRASPMSRMKPPRLPEERVPVIGEEDPRKLLGAWGPAGRAGWRGGSRRAGPAGPAVGAQRQR